MEEMTELEQWQDTLKVAIAREKKYPGKSNEAAVITAKRKIAKLGGRNGGQEKRSR